MSHLVDSDNTEEVGDLFLADAYKLGFVLDPGGHLPSILLRNPEGKIITIVMTPEMAKFLISAMAERFGDLNERG